MVNIHEGIRKKEKKEHLNLPARCVHYGSGDCVVRNGAGQGMFSVFFLRLSCRSGAVPFLKGLFGSEQAELCRLVGFILLYGNEMGGDDQQDNTHRTKRGKKNVNEP